MNTCTKCYIILWGLFEAVRMNPKPRVILFWRVCHMWNIHILVERQGLTQVSNTQTLFLLSKSLTSWNVRNKIQNTYFLFLYNFQKYNILCLCIVGIKTVRNIVLFPTTSHMTEKAHLRIDARQFLWNSSQFTFQYLVFAWWVILGHPTASSALLKNDLKSMYIHSVIYSVIVPCFHHHRHIWLDSNMGWVRICPKIQILGWKSRGLEPP